MEKKTNISPLMVRSFGRSGSTLMMQLLGTSDNVLFERTYPFENRYLTYIYRLIKLAGSIHPADPEWNQDHVMLSNVKKIGGWPYRNINLFNTTEFSETLLRPIWRQFSNSLLEKNKDIDLSKPVFYAEKIAHDISETVNSALPAKTIFLFRDPRDEFLSIKHFNKKRGYFGFGWQENDTDATFAEKMCNSRKGTMKIISNIKEHENRRIMVLYENLITQPETELHKLSAWLGIEFDWKKIVDNQHLYKHHMTSSDMKETVARWKSEMPDEIKKIFKDKLGNELQALGYEI